MVAWIKLVLEKVSIESQYGFTVGSVVGIVCRLLEVGLSNRLGCCTLHFCLIHEMNWGFSCDKYYLLVWYNVYMYMSINCWWWRYDVRSEGIGVVGVCLYLILSLTRHDRRISSSVSQIDGGPSSSYIVVGFAHRWKVVVIVNLCRFRRSMEDAWFFGIGLLGGRT